jgi:hypothetical protein
VSHYYLFLPTGLHRNHKVLSDQLVQAAKGKKGTAAAGKKAKEKGKKGAAGEPEDEEANRKVIFKKS